MNPNLNLLSFLFQGGGGTRVSEFFYKVSKIIIFLFRGVRGRGKGLELLIFLLRIHGRGRGLESLHFFVS